MKTVKILLEFTGCQFNAKLLDLYDTHFYEALEIEVEIPSTREETSTPHGLFGREVLDIENFKVLDYTSDCFLYDSETYPRENYTNEEIATEYRQQILAKLQDLSSKGKL